MKFCEWSARRRVGWSVIGSGSVSGLSSVFGSVGGMGEDEDEDEGSGLF